jgi:hypothetical protein
MSPMSQERHVAPNWGRTSLPEPIALCKGLEVTHELGEACSTKLGSDFVARADCLV